jgi:branched-chain amino acid transport system permease protein
MSGTETVATESEPGRRGRSRRSRWRLPTGTLARHLTLALLGLLGIVLLLELTSPFRNSQFAAMTYYAIAAAGLTVLTGLNGQISLGHGALMAVGAYTTGLLAAQLPFLLVMLIAAAAAGLVGMVVGVAAARLHGPYLAGATLALAVALPGLAIHFDDLLGGEQGMRISSLRPPAWFTQTISFLSGNPASSSKWLAYVGALSLLVVLVLLANLVAGRFGRVWRAVRDDEVAAELAGIRLGRVRVLAFVVSAVCAGLAGAVLAVVVRLAAPSGFSIVLSLSLLTAVVVGGLGSLTGAVLGSAMLVFLPPSVTELGSGLGLTDVQSAQLAPFVYGAVLIAVMLLAPKGAMGFVRRWTAGRSRGRRAR